MDGGTQRLSRPNGSLRMKMKKIIYSVLVLAVANSFFTGCGFRQPYKHEGKKNLTIESDISGTLNESVKGFLKISSMDKDCHSKYEGILRLEDGTNMISLPEGKMMVLDIVYSRQRRINFFTTPYLVEFSHEGIVDVKKGDMYKLSVNYKDRFYNDELFKQNRKNKKFKELTMYDRKACRQLKKKH